MNSDHLELMSDRNSFKMYSDFAIAAAIIVCGALIVGIVLGWLSTPSAHYLSLYMYFIAWLAFGGFVVSAVVGLRYKRRVEAGEKLQRDYALLRKRWPAKIPCPTFEEYKRGYINTKEWLIPERWFTKSNSPAGPRSPS